MIFYDSCRLINIPVNWLSVIWYQLTSYGKLSQLWTVQKRNKQKFLKCSMIYQKIVPKSTQANESNFNLMAGLASKLEFQGLLWRHLYSQRTCVANPTLLTPIQPKIHDLIKISYFAAHCTNQLPYSGNVWWGKFDEFGESSAILQTKTSNYD